MAHVNTNDRKMMEHILDCLKDSVIKFDLQINKRIDGYGSYVELEDENDWLYVSYATHHPHDYPFRFVAAYCKQGFINKDAPLYRTDTKEITPLWRFDDKLDTNLSGVFEEDMPIVTECCKRAAEMFSYFQAMSDEEYIICSTGSSFSSLAH